MEIENVTENKGETAKDVLVLDTSSNNDFLEESDKEEVGVVVERDEKHPASKNIHYVHDDEYSDIVDDDLDKILDDVMRGDSDHLSVTRISFYDRNNHDDGDRSIAESVDSWSTDGHANKDEKPFTKNMFVSKDTSFELDRQDTLSSADIYREEEQIDSAQPAPVSCESLANEMESEDGDDHQAVNDNDHDNDVSEGLHSAADSKIKVMVDTAATYAAFCFSDETTKVEQNDIGEPSSSWEEETLAEEKISPGEPCHFEEDGFGSANEYTEEEIFDCEDYAIEDDRWEGAVEDEIPLIPSSLLREIRGFDLAALVVPVISSNVISSKKTETLPANLLEEIQTFDHQTFYSSKGNVSTKPAGLLEEIQIFDHKKLNSCRRTVSTNLARLLRDIRTFDYKTLNSCRSKVPINLARLLQEIREFDRETLNSSTGVSTLPTQLLEEIREFYSEASTLVSEPEVSDKKETQQDTDTYVATIPYAFKTKRRVCFRDTVEEIYPEPRQKKETPKKKAVSKGKPDPLFLDVWNLKMLGIADEGAPEEGRITNIVHTNEISRQDKDSEPWAELIGSRKNSNGSSSNDDIDDNGIIELPPIEGLAKPKQEEIQQEQEKLVAQKARLDSYVKRTSAVSQTATEQVANETLQPETKEGLPEIPQDFAEAAGVWTSFTPDITYLLASTLSKLQSKDKPTTEEPTKEDPTKEEPTKEEPLSFCDGGGPEWSCIPFQTQQLEEENSVLTELGSEGHFCGGSTAKGSDPFRERTQTDDIFDDLKNMEVKPDSLLNMTMSFGNESKASAVSDLPDPSSSTLPGATLEMERLQVLVTNLMDHEYGIEFSTPVDLSAFPETCKNDTKYRPIDLGTILKYVFDGCCWPCCDF